jgi:hypothetical protein
MRTILAFALVASLFCPAAGAVGPDGLTDTEATVFLASLQDAIRAENPGQVAALVKFPLRVGFSSRQSPRPDRVVNIANAEEFIRRYSELFTPEVRAAVLSQPSDTLFRNWQGVMIGNGELWYADVCRDKQCSAHRIRVISVNVIK